MRVIRLVILVCMLCVFSVGGASGWSWGSSWLVKINGVEYTREDFIHWWENWKEKDTPLPKTLEPFIEWFLLSQEGERMKLFEDPPYRRKVQIFLEARALMLLKAEEVNKKIRISQREVKNIYEKKYIPLLHVRAVVFPGEKEVKAFLGKMKKDGDFEELVKKEFPKNNRRAFDWGWRRPFVFPAPVRESLVKMKEGEVTGPVNWMGKFWLIKLVEKKGGSDEDFKGVKATIERALRKKQEAKLTLNLIEKLKKKYHVWVDEALLQSLDVEKQPPKDQVKKPLIKMGKGVVTVGDFLIQMKREMEFRKKFKFPTEDKDKIKKRVMNDLISQTLTTWESLNRHYEKKPPFKWVFRFYCQHRIIREMENQLFWPKVKVTEEDAGKYYKEHPDQFTLPALVKVAIIQTGDEKLAKKMERALNGGKGFFVVARRLTFHDALIRRVPVNHLDPKMREMVSELSPAEVGPPVKIGDHIYLVKLIDRVSGRQRPFSKVKKEIIEKLRKERFKEIKKVYLSKLKEKSKIKVNEAAWEKLRQELGRKDEQKKAG